MQASDLIRAGDLDGALASLQSAVRAQPADGKLRIFLFQLLCVLGDWKRAVTQLRLCAELDAEALSMAQTYREAIICEVYREKVFAGEKSPLILGEPEEWVALLIEAVKALAQGNAAEAADLRAKAFEMAPTSAGELNDQPFEWIADADMRLGPVLEVIIAGKYFWVPFASIAILRLDPPTDLRDAVWMPGHLTLRNGGEMVTLLPARYPLGPKATAAAKLSRATDWSDVGHDTWIGSGQKLLTTDQGESAVMDLRSLVLAPGTGT